MKNRRLAALALALVSVPLFPRAGEIEVFFGTYTRGESQGIYRSKMNRESGALSAAVPVAELTNPSFLAVSPDGNTLYAVSESSEFRGQEGGGLVAYRIGEDGLEEISARSTGGRGPCHLSVHPAGAVVAVANYGGGSVAAFPVDGDGRTGPRASLVQHEGSSIHPKRQREPHAHSIRIFGDGTHAAAADLGTDSVFLYRLDGEGVLEQAAEIKLDPGSGPRHIAIHPSQPFAYVINEMTLTVAVFRMEGMTTWDLVEAVSTLPPGAEETGSTAEIRVHPSGRFLYGSNRGHDSIACFVIDPEDGTLTRIENEPIRGEVPRNFGISPDGKFLLAAGQRSDSVAVFAIDAETGELEFTGHEIKVPSPVCVVFRQRLP